MRVCFVVGHEDTPEAYWRVLLPSRSLGAHAVAIDGTAARATALAADVLWIHQPTSIAAADLAEKARARGGAVVVDMSEDPWRRTECDQSYNAVRIESCERALDAAHLVVLAMDQLEEPFAAYDARVVKTVIPTAGWEVRTPLVPATISWWSDGRQRRGLEGVADEIIAVIDRKPEVKIRHIQYAHFKALTSDLTDSETKADRSKRFHFYLEGDLGAEGNLSMLRTAMAGSAVALECYPGGYGQSVSDLPLLRSAMLGVPSITTRLDAPPGAISAQPGEWLDAITGLLDDPGRQQVLAREARGWAESRASFDSYRNIIEEVSTWL